MITCEFEDGNQANLRHAVVDTIVVDNGQLLLVRRAPHLREGGKLALPGGFMDRDETAQEAAAREVREETGYEVSIDRMITVVDRPDRGEDRQNVSLVFLAHPTNAEPVDHDAETSEVRWVPLKHLPSESEFAFDHHRIVQEYLTAVQP